MFSKVEREDGLARSGWGPHLSRKDQGASFHCESLLTTLAQVVIGMKCRLSQKGIAWAGVAISFVFFTARIGIRIKAFNKLFADDALVFFACLLLLINSIIWQVSKDDLYLDIGISSGQIFPPPVDFPERTTRYLRRTVIVIVFFYTGLWAIKLSFLIFFRRLGHNVRNQKPVWWTVLAITVATYFACLGTIEYHCLAGSFEYILGGQIYVL